ncbi:hypothetical protein BC629DRAFT_1512511 [Irpex lacteus]|nr:hypothetical protein BC629DRAFT_1512511 [Irpex lacteus]
MESENVKPRNPLDDILDYILECSDANVAIACHDDLQPFTLNDDWTITLPGLLRRLQPEIDIHESGKCACYIS